MMNRKESDKMDTDIAYCGLNCAECEAYISTENDDEKMREELAKKWTEDYGQKIDPDEIICDGCSDMEGRHIDYWEQCQIRRCCEEKEIENCAHCGEYPCEELQSFFEMAVGTKERLDEIRKNL